MPAAAPSPWLPKPTLRGERVTLRPFRDGDAETMAALLADPELLKMTASVTSTAEALEFCAKPDQKMRDWYDSRAEADGRLDLAIVDNGTGQLVGESVLNDWDANANSCNFRILIGAAGRNRGLGTEATILTVDYGFEHCGLHRISLDVYAFNPRGRRVYEKAGFTVEGVRRDALRFDDEYVDEVMMAILRPDWQAAGGAINSSHDALTGMAAVDRPSGSLD